MLVTHYTEKEGGEWLKWEKWPHPQFEFWARYNAHLVILYPTSRMGCKLVHALRFENGQEWDAINGSRGDFGTLKPIINQMVN